MDIKELMRQSGIIGAGGAGFPSYAKISEGANLLLINGAECEPLLYTDYTILKREMHTVLSGIGAVLEAANIPEARLVIKEHTAKRLSLSDGEHLSDNIEIKVLPNVYPIGDEIALIYEATGRLVTPGTLPGSVGVIVFNVETVYNLGRALLYGEPVTEKWLTVGGDVERPVVVRVPVGIRVSELLSRLGIKVGEEHTLIDGGPSMGKKISLSRAVVTKTTKGILLLPDSCRAAESKYINERAAVARAETACCQCTRCTDMCPRALLGYPLEPHKMVRTAMQAAVVMPEMVLSATLCSGCGICENLACSQGISPKAVINNYKELLRKNKMRYVSPAPVSVTREREYRMIPSEKWESTIGVLRFDRVAEYIGRLDGFECVEIPVGTHIGAPSFPSVTDGEEVVRGDLIAEAAHGLSVAQHASIDGKVRLSEGKIVITSK